MNLYFLLYVLFISFCFSNVINIPEDYEFIQEGMTCPPKVVPSVKLVVVQNERNREYDT